MRRSNASYPPGIVALGWAVPAAIATTFIRGVYPMQVEEGRRRKGSKRRTRPAKPERGLTPKEELLLLHLLG